MKRKFFNGKKYSLVRGYWIRTTLLSHDIWNFYHPTDPILKGDSYVIHHDNEDSSDDRIENLQKMTIGEHSSLHTTGTYHTDATKQKMSDRWTEELKQKVGKTILGPKNPNWKGGKKKWMK